jgi:hypothetical protein
MMIQERILILGCVIVRIYTKEDELSFTEFT